MFKKCKEICNYALVCFSSYFLISLFNSKHFDYVFSREEIEQKYSGKITQDISGPVFEVVSKVLNTICQRKITVPAQHFKRFQSKKLFQFLFLVIFLSVTDALFSPQKLYSIYEHD